MEFPLQRVRIRIVTSAHLRTPPAWWGESPREPSGDFRALSRPPRPKTWSGSLRKVTEAYRSHFFTPQVRSPASAGSRLHATHYVPISFPFAPFRVFRGH